MSTFGQVNSEIEFVVIPTPPSDVTKFLRGDNTWDTIPSNPNDPTADEKAALAGTSGSPSATNKYLTDVDPRNSDARVPTSHGHPQSDVTNLVTDLAAKATPADITSAISTHAGEADPHAGYQKESEKGAANGYASLGAGSLVPMSQLATGTPDGTKFIRDDGTLQVTGGGPHASTHQHSGGDEVATAVAAANAIPKAGAGGTLASGWIPDLSSTYAVAAKGVTNGDAHDHAGGDGAQIAYSSLSGLPTLGSIADNAEADFAVAGKGVTNGDTHDHNGGDGAQIDHVNLANKGTNTHAQIDSHISAGAPHSGHEATVNKGAVSGYAGLGANSVVPTVQLGSGSASGTTYLRGDQTWATPAGGGVPLIKQYFAVPILANLAWSNMPVALSFWLLTASTSAHIEKIDLTNYTQCRLKAHKRATAGAAASKLILRYSTTFSQAVAGYSNIGTSEVSIAINVQNQYLTTAWINLAAGAKADVFVTLLGSGGDGALDPVFGIVVAEFK